MINSWKAGGGGGGELDLIYTENTSVYFPQQNSAETPAGQFLEKVKKCSSCRSLGLTETSLFFSLPLSLSVSLSVSLSLSLSLSLKSTPCCCSFAFPSPFTYLFCQTLELPRLLFWSQYPRVYWASPYTKEAKCLVPLVLPFNFLSVPDEDPPPPLG